jgi:hypothetical protein
MALTLASVVWRYAVHAQLVRPDMADEDMKTFTKRLTHVGRLLGDHCGTVPTSFAVQDRQRRLPAAS